MSTALVTARVIGSLVAVLLLAFVAARFARRTTPGRGRGDLRVCQRVGLTRDTAAVVLETDGRRLLIGVSPTQISLLADLGPHRCAELEAAADVVPAEVVPAQPAQPARPALPTRRSQRAATSSRNPVSRNPVSEIPAPRAASRRITVPLPRRGGQADVVITKIPLSRKVIRQLDQRRRRLAMPPTQRGTGSVLDPRTWRQGIEALRDLTARRG